MPLIILGLILLIGLLIYSVIRYINSGDPDPRPVRERYPHAFSLSGPDSHEASGRSGSDDNIIEFPKDNIEAEKIKRNIH